MDVWREIRRLGRTYVFVPLCDLDKTRTAIGPNTILRCKRAVQFAAKVHLDGGTVTFVLAAGVEPARRGPGAKTAAAMMADWFKEELTEPRLIVNETSPNIPDGTIGEVEWALKAAIEDFRSLNTRENAAAWDDCTGMVFVSVSNERHNSRIRRTLKWLHNLPPSLWDDLDLVPDGSGSTYSKVPAIQFESSDDEPPAWKHEFFAYGKLVFYRLGLEKSAGDLERLLIKLLGKKL